VGPSGRRHDVHGGPPPQPLDKVDHIAGIPDEIAGRLDRLQPQEVPADPPDQYVDVVKGPSGVRADLRRAGSNHPAGESKSAHNPDRRSGPSSGNATGPCPPSRDTFAFARKPGCPTPSAGAREMPRADAPPPVSDGRIIVARLQLGQRSARYSERRGQLALDIRRSPRNGGRSGP